MLVRADSGGGTHEFLNWLTAPSHRLHYSAGMTITQDMQAAILKVTADAWAPAYDGSGQVREGAWAADITGMLDLDSWPARMRPSGGRRPLRAARRRQGHRPPEASGRLPADHARAEPSLVRPGR